MRKRSLHTIWWLPAALVCLADVNAEEVPTVKEQTPQEIALTFGWHDGISAKVEGRVGRIRKHFLPEAQPKELSFKYNLQTSQSGEHLLVEAKGLKATDKSSTFGVAAQTVLQLGGIYPRMSVTREGEFVSLVDRSRFLTDAVDVFSTVVEKADQNRVSEFVTSQLSSEQVLTTMSQKFWHNTVWTWAGETLDFNSEYGAETTTPHPLLPSVNVKMYLTFLVAPSKECAPSANVETCVRLTMLYEYDTDDLLRIALALAAKYPDRDEVKKISSSRFEELSERYTVLTDAQTLLPLEVQYLKTTLISGEAGKDGRQEYVDLKYSYR